MDQPMTSAELFEKISSILKDKGLMPEILDYGLAAFHPAPLTNYEFDVRSNLGYGASEGIYLDVWLECWEGGKRVLHDLGTFKTLDKSDEAMHTMANLLADFIITENHYVNANLDDFTWEGANVYPVDDPGWCYSCKTMEQALKQRDKLLEKYEKVVIRDNATRKETVYGRD